MMQRSDPAEPSVRDPDSAVKYIQTSSDQIKYRGYEDRKRTVRQHHFIQFSRVRRRRKTLHDILAGNVRGTRVKSCSHNNDKYAVFQEIPVEYGFLPTQEFSCLERLEDRSYPSVNMKNQKNKCKGDTYQQNGTLYKICPKYRFQPACVGINNRDDTHHKNQNVDVDSRQIGEHHRRKIHNNRHSSDLIDDEHHGSQHTEPFAAKTKFQIMVRSINIQLTVNREKEPDGKRNCNQHSQLSKPQNPGAPVRIARQREK